MLASEEKRKKKKKSLQGWATAVSSRLHCYHGNRLGFMSMHPQAINASMGRASMVGSEIKPDCINDARACRVQNIVSLRIALLEVVSKLG